MPFLPKEIPNAHLLIAGKGVYLMKALGRGKLADRAEDALKYAFKIPYAHAVSVGIKSLEELETAVKVEEEVDKYS